MGKQIKDFPAAAAAALTDQIGIDDVAGITKKVTLQQVGDTLMADMTADDVNGALEYTAADAAALDTLEGTVAGHTTSIGENATAITALEGRAEVAGIILPALRMLTDDLSSVEFTRVDGAVTSVLANGMVQEVRRSGGLVTSVGGKQVDSTFTRTSPAWDPYTGAESASGVPRFVEIAGTVGLMCEEAGTNLLTANQSSIETDTTGFSSFGATIARTTESAWTGSSSLLVTVNSAGSGRGSWTFHRFPVAAGLPYTFSAYARQKSGGAVDLRCIVQWFDVETGGTALSSTNGVSTTINASDYQRLSLTATAPAGATWAQLLVYSSNSVSVGDAWYLDGLAAKQKAYFDSWSIGGVTRAAETLAIPTADTFEKGDWGLVIPFRNNPSVAAGVLWECRIDANNGYRLLKSGGALRLEVESGGTTVGLTHGTTLSNATDYIVTLTGNGANMDLAVSGVASSGAVAYTEPVGTLPTNMYLGSDADGANQANAIAHGFQSMTAFTGTNLADYSTTAPTAPTAAHRLFLPLSSDLLNVARVVDLTYTAGELTGMERTTATLG